MAAETLVARLQGTVMVSVEVEKPQQAQGDGEESADKYPVLTRVQGLVAADPGAVSQQAERTSNGERTSNNECVNNGGRTTNLPCALLLTARDDMWHA